MDAVQTEYHYLSSLMERRIVSADGLPLGKTWDLVVDLDRPEPEVTKLVYRVSWSTEKRTVPWHDVASIDPARITLKESASLPGPLLRVPSEILLRDFLLDKQIVDIHGAKVERVNDLLFRQVNGKLVIEQVDVGVKGLLRRLGFERAISRFLKWFFDYTLREKFIAWTYVQPLADPDRLRLQVPLQRLAELHPADLADIMEDMDVHERAVVVESLEEEVLADALEEMDPKVQVSIVRGLAPEKAADIIEEMSPDEAADLIADLPEETAEGIFKEMDEDYGSKVKQLLAHEEDEAGGLMTTTFMALSPDATILDALAYIKQNARKMDVIYYIYVVDSEGRLLGVTNLRELLSAEIFTPLERIMTRRLITAKIDDDTKDLAALFAKYGFRGVPVVDEENRIQGVIRFKALLEIVAPHLGQ
ncbi:MAG: CBS domain-containing protein [Desulfomonile sp.]|nr:CBS domain-containing protein [Desulfomonile sp.]